MCVPCCDALSAVSAPQAVAAMKASPTLDLLVRRGAGCDLFPGESSGYNSSASSVAGGESPSWDEPAPAAAPNGHVRLAPLREESVGQSSSGHHVSTTGELFAKGGIQSASGVFRRTGARCGSGRRAGDVSGVSY